MAIMDEFSLIKTFFGQSSVNGQGVVFGIGDDAACLEIPPNQQVLVSTDTLVADVHFLSSWDAYAIAYKAVMVNVSDIAAMAGKPCWVNLALTLPAYNQTWLERFSEGLHTALEKFNLVLLGGDTTRGPLTITITIQGLVPCNQAVRRNGATVGDRIYVSGELGAAAFALNLDSVSAIAADSQCVMTKLMQPFPRVDFVDVLRKYATALIDISDGLSADLNHICSASVVGATLIEQNIPVHPLVKKYDPENALQFALYGGDDYELCFTIPPSQEDNFLLECQRQNLTCYFIGIMEKKPGLRMQTSAGDLLLLAPKGYNHFAAEI